jgi:hypothetical protein
MKKYIDVFNGDADGICALHQLRLADPRPDAMLVTGVKRDIQLLHKLSNVQGKVITVLDISLDSNRQDMMSLLAANNQVFYVDHHFCGDIPGSPNLQAHIDPSPDTCTSLIVDQLLHGKYRAWAVAAAFGDNLQESALLAAAPLSLAEHEVTKLKELGELLNYNGYGPTVADLHFPPEELYREISSFADPLEFHESSKVLARLRQGYIADMDKALSFQPVQQSPAGRVFELPAESWARRVSGVFSNLKAQEQRDLAHALLIRNADKTYRINVRAPLQNKQNADTLCRTFPTGGGRAAAAGINNLPQELLQDFLSKFEEVFGKKPVPKVS